MISDSVALDLALRRARRGEGQTVDNPSVGCLILSPEGEGLALAHTAPGGRPHAEEQALTQAGHRAKGARAFVTLEPCSHEGRSGSCAEALITAQVAEVVVGVRDANPKVSGQGLAKLRAAGIAVIEADHEGCRTHHAGFNRRMRGQRPWVTLKIATSVDGGMTRQEAKQRVRITGPEVERQVHLLRTRSDILITGPGTVTVDQPRLNVRLPGYTRVSPQVLVWQRSFTLEALEANRVLIEAGPRLASALFDQIDELVWYRSPIAFGKAAVRPDFLPPDPLDFQARWPTFRLVARRTYGADRGEVWRRR